MCQPASTSSSKSSGSCASAVKVRAVPVAVGLELPAQARRGCRCRTRASARRVERADGAARDGGVALGVGVLPGEHDAAALREVELREREPRGELARLGERAPDALDRVASRRSKRITWLVAAALEGSVRHQSSCRSRWRSSASSRPPQSSR